MAHRFLRRPEVLQRLGIKREALRELINDDHFPPGTAIVPGGRAQGWLEEDVDKYIEERRKLAHKEKGIFPEKGSGKKTMEKSDDDKRRQREPNVDLDNIARELDALLEDQRVLINERDQRINARRPMKLQQQE